jgi:hypothetical protein
MEDGVVEEAVPRERDEGGARARRELLIERDREAPFVGPQDEPVELVSVELFRRRALRAPARRRRIVAVLAGGFGLPAARRKRQYDEPEEEKAAHGRRS